MTTTPNTTPRTADARDLGLLIIRLGLGTAFILHGWPKLIAGTTTWHMVGGAMGLVGIHFAPTFWGFLSVLAEIGGGLLLVLGLLTRFAAAVLVINMAVAIMFHLHAPGIPEYMHEFGSGWSHALEDGVVFLGLVFTGAGRYSIDAMTCCGGRSKTAVPPAGT